MSARNTHTRPDREIVGALKSLDGVGSTGVGTAYDLGAAYSGFTVQTVIAGSTSATVQLQGKLGDSTSWQQLGSNITADSTSNGAIVLVQQRDGTTAKAVTAVRLNVSAMTTSASTTAESLDGWIAVS